jgi:hypothetical protein
VVAPADGNASSCPTLNVSPLRLRNANTEPQYRPSCNAISTFNAGVHPGMHQ